MPPIRRYLRITKYTVLEVRIHLSQPSQVNWLLKGNNPALPRVIAAIRPLILPKLRDENEKASGKGAAKKKAARDIIQQDDYEVSIFFTDNLTRHSLLTKTIVFSNPKKPKELTDWLEPARIEAQSEDDPKAIEDEPIFIREESTESMGLRNAPGAEELGDADDADEKKAPRTSYKGFSIYGRVLCLVISRTNLGATGAKTASSQQMMENWISTQVAKADLESTELG